MFTRLIVNLTQVYIPIYVSGSLLLAKQYIAIIPFVMYICGFIASFLMKPVNAFLGRKATYAIGLLLVLGSCIWMRFLSTSIALEVIGVAVLLGAGTSTILVTSLSITADLIGPHVVSAPTFGGILHGLQLDILLH